MERIYGIACQFKNGLEKINIEKPDFLGEGRGGGVKITPYLYQEIFDKITHQQQ